MVSQVKIILPTTVPWECQANTVYKIAQNHSTFSLDVTQLLCSNAAPILYSQTILFKYFTIVELAKKVVPPPPFVRIHDSPSHTVTGVEEKCFSIKSGMSLLGL